MVNAPGLGAVVFAGGRGSRLGGVDKAALELGGVPLVERAVAAAEQAGVDAPIVVGPPGAAPARCTSVREQPPYSGPLAALAAALAVLPPDADEVLLLACDLVRPDEVVARLRASAPSNDEDGVLLRDPDGRAQWLAGRYRAAALRDAVAALDGDVAGRPLRRVMDALRLRPLDASAETVADIDTPEDLERARRTTRPPDPANTGAYPETERAPGGAMTQSHHLPPEALDAWLVAAAAELGVEPDAVRIGTVLDVARDVAHDVARPAAPLSTFLLGVAYGRAGAADPDRLQGLADRLTERAAAWKDDRDASQ
ncbi:NTP transferase domain-containing protein [Leucobacter chromiiresistens]